MVQIEKTGVHVLPIDLSDKAIAAILENRIRTGVYSPGARLPAERTLAEEFGVSRRFIRMAFGLLIERGLMEKPHYRRPFVTLSDPPVGEEKDIDLDSSHAESSTNAAQTIAAILPSHPNFPGGLSTIAGIHKTLAYAGKNYALKFLDTFHKERSEVLRLETNAIRSLDQYDISGLIWWSYLEDDQIAEIMASNPNLPIVFIDRHPRSFQCDFVGIDDVESSRAAVEYLFDLNHRRVAHLMDPGSYSTIMERAEGYRQAHIVRDLPYSEELVVHLDWSADRIKRAYETLFSLKEPPTALLTSNDFIAYEFMNYLEENGKAAPEDLSIVGHGNIDRYSLRQFLTSVEQPFEGMGKAAAKLLLKRLVNRDDMSNSFQQIILPTPLIIRSSCKKLDRPNAAQLS